MSHTAFILPDVCLTSYTLLDIMKSTLIFRMLCHNIKIVQIVENSSDCSHAQKYLQIHTHAAETFSFLFFTKQVSPTCAQQINLHWSEHKNAHRTVNIRKIKLQKQNVTLRGSSLCQPIRVSSWLMTSSTQVALISSESCSSLAMSSSTSSTSHSSSPSHSNPLLLFLFLSLQHLPLL